MKARVNISFTPEGADSQIKLPALDYQLEEGRIPAMANGGVRVELPDGSSVTINSAWTPSNDMVSIMVYRNGKLVGHSGNCWHLGDPYLGVQIEAVGFLHLYLKK